MQGWSHTGTRVWNLPKDIAIPNVTRQIRSTDPEPNGRRLTYLQCSSSTPNCDAEAAIPIEEFSCFQVVRW